MPALLVQLELLGHFGQAAQMGEQGVQGLAHQAEMPAGQAHGQQIGGHGDDQEGELEEEQPAGEAAHVDQAAVDDGDAGVGAPSNSGPLANGSRPLQPAEIKVAQELFEKQPVDFLDEQISAQVDEALANGSLSKDMDLFVEAGDTLAKKKVGAVLDDLEADQVLVRELTACVEGTTEAVA